MKCFSAFLVLACFAPAVSAQTSSSNVAAYQNRCASCHGATMAGGSAQAILTYIRYHTDSEVTAAIRERHRGIQAAAVPDSDLPAIMAGMRELAGTNPAMATGGFTGRRGGPVQERKRGGRRTCTGCRSAVYGSACAGCSASAHPYHKVSKVSADDNQDGRRPCADGRVACAVGSVRRASREWALPTALEGWKCVS